MSAFTKFQAFSQDLGRKLHNLHTDSLKVMLSNVAPDPAANAVKGDITEIAAGFGYSAGGTAVTGQSYSQTAGVGKLVFADVTFTATGGALPAFRYAVLYNDTAAGKNLIGFWDRGSSLTLADGNSAKVDVDGTAGVLTLT